MNKLEIKHIAPRLQYGICDRYGVISGIDSNSSQGVVCLVNYFETKNNVSYGVIEISEIKPILRPLSDLGKPIVQNGIEFTPINELKHLYGWEYCWTYVKNNQGQFNVYALEYASVLKLLEWHFDIDGLIDKGLAIDVNTLEENPYK